MNQLNSKIEIYTSQSGEAQIEVKFDGETVWLNLNQISNLFGKHKSVVSRHLKNIFNSGELHKDSVVAKYATTALDGKIYVVEYFNLDVIISIGYRVNSIRGTQFRQWATKRIREYLIEGISINEKRLAQKNKEIQVLHDGIRILGRAIEVSAVADNNYAWLHRFSIGLKLLDDYDHEVLDASGQHLFQAEYPTVREYEALVSQMRMSIRSNVFGLEKDGGFISAINQIKQCFGELDLYPSVEEKAAMLLYLVVKNHAFIDGNKRIAAACFLMFLDRNGLLYATTGQTIISNEALASLTLFVAASNSSEMETVKKLLISVLNRNMS